MEQSEISEVFFRSMRVFFILNCGHWYKSTNVINVPRAGSLMTCPVCNIPKVTNNEKRQDDSATPKK